ncbi:hypothetical protein Cni_G17620 [Canna indica]|uniref:Uncharacterized protein n=1 Tax=Canna indica TaxID=4628 RepID=A0AAQ3KMQ4_9LILI|nr:hypothetical protein Cni_G17620 [Canna indica]
MSSSSSKGMAAAMACFLCLGFLLSVSVVNGGVPSAATTVIIVSTGTSSGDHFLDSKRRVPNGPDPIHNRRIGKLGRPPAGA